ncbi:MAG: hypothetical protein K2W96_01115 [Gemmataceae bacterium]|nr:hypothetical protein [Gemmataceae bacterium]
MAAVLDSAGISTQQSQKLMADAQALLKATGLTKADAQTITSDVKAIITTAQQNAKGKKK